MRRTDEIEQEKPGIEPPDARFVCPNCGAVLEDLRGKLQCPRCHLICETCCEGGRG